MQARYALLLFLLLVPVAEARQDSWATSAIFATHEFPDQTIPLGHDFTISGTVAVVGGTDIVALGVLTVDGCTVMAQDTEGTGTDGFAWTALLRQDEPTCNWHRYGFYNDTSLGGLDRATVASGTTTAFGLVDLGQSTETGLAGQWFLPIFFLLLAVWFWVNGNSMPGVIAWLAALGLVVPGLPSSGRIWVILALGIVIPLHHYWSNIKIFVDKRRNGA